MPEAGGGLDLRELQLTTSCHEDIQTCDSQAEPRLDSVTPTDDAERDLAADRAAHLLLAPRRTTTRMENNEDAPRRRGVLRKVVAGYLPFTALAIATAIAIIGLSRSWAAVLAGGVILLLWSVAIALSQLTILLFKVDSRFYLKCAAMTVFSIFGAPLVFAGINQAAVAIFIGKPDLDRLLREGSPKRCQILEIKDDRRISRSSYYISAVVSCEPENHKQLCVWWFHKADEWIPSPLASTSRCPIGTRQPAK